MIVEQFQVIEAVGMSVVSLLYAVILIWLAWVIAPQWGDLGRVEEKKAAMRAEGIWHLKPDIEHPDRSMVVTRWYPPQDDMPSSVRMLVTGDARLDDAIWGDHSFITDGYLFGQLMRIEAQKAYADEAFARGAVVVSTLKEKNIDLAGYEDFFGA